ncbi:MAG: hypothetical protein RMJ67_08590 [Elusimicrobiota bacterium]|nr:hypothetical protein [Endomicrobiia bacterium]MDW8166553.1 hypothetical protein [Elusimicrobiota bacterium]
MISKSEKEELLKLLQSKKFKEDMRIVSKNKHNPFVKEGTVDIDKYIEFLNQYNKFINHTPKKFKPILIKCNKIL